MIIVLFSFVPLAAIISLSKVKSWEEVGYWQCRLAWLTTEGSCAAYRGVSGRGESKLAQMQAAVLLIEEFLVVEKVSWHKCKCYLMT